MACKKYEKICFDNGSVDKLEMVDDMSGKPGMFSIAYLIVT